MVNNKSCINRYFATFVAGTHEIVKSLLTENFEDLKLENLFRNFIVFKSSCNCKKISNVPYLSNVFTLVNKFGSRNMQNFVKLLEWSKTSPKFLKLIVDHVKKNNCNSFRIHFFEDTKSISRKNELEDLTKFIEINTYLKYSPCESDFEIWFIKRSEEIALIGIKLTQKKDYQDILNKGEIRSELAYILNYLAEVSTGDTVLDPFCGSGAIPVSTVKHFEAHSVVASDVDTVKIRKVMKDRGIEDLVIDIENYDGFKLEKLTDESVDRIITDPPWGEYQDIDSLQDKYRTMISNFDRVLKNGGVLVLLVSKRSNFHKHIDKIGSFDIVDRYEVMVGGKESEIFKIKKI